MSQGAVTFLYTGDANSVQKNTAPCDIATVGLLYTNLQPKYELRSSTRFGQFQKFEKLSWGTVSQLRKNFCTGFEFLFMATCA